MKETVDERAEKLIKKYNKGNKSGATPRGMRMGPGPGGRGRRNGKVSKPKNTKATILRLAGYISEDKLKLVIVVFFVILTAITTLAGSYMLRPIINNLIKAENAKSAISQLAHSLLLMGSIYLIGVIATYTQQRIMIGISQKAVYRIRKELFEKVQDLPVRFYDTNNHGDLMSRFTNDVDTVGEVLNNTVVQLISGTISIVGTFSIMVYTNVILTIVTLVMLPIFTFAAKTVAGHSRKYFSGQQAALGAVNSYIEETVTGEKVVKVFCHEDIANEEFKILNDDLKTKQIKAQFYSGIMGPVMNNLGQLNYALTACVGGILCITTGFDIGGLAIFVNFSRQFSRPINEISQQIQTIFSALAGAERVFEIMDEAPESNEGKNLMPDKIEGNVRFDSVTFSYNPGKVILNNVSFYAKPGQKIALVGSTGAGKTTITNLLTRFYDIDSGKVTVDDIDIKDIKREYLRQNITMVLQDTHLFTGTVMENIRYGRLDATDEEVIEAAKLASADSFIRKLPDGYNTVLEGDGTNLSQGQRQLINIARASISKAPILILDEATSSVDTRTERHIERGMDRLMATRTTFVIAHRLSTVRNANAIMVLENGEIIERGTHEELLKMKGRYYDLYTGITELD